MFDQINTLTAHQSSITAISTTQNSSYFITSSSDCIIKLWSLNHYSQIQSYSKQHSLYITDLSISPNNFKFSSVSKDNQLIIYDFEKSFSKSERKFKNCHYNGITCSKYLNDNLIITGGNDKKVKIWDLRSNNYKPIQVFNDAKDSISDLTCIGNTQKNGKGNDCLVLTGSLDGKLRTYDLRFGNLTTDTIGYSISSIEISEDCNMVLIFTNDDIIRLFDLLNGKLLNKFEIPTKNSSTKTNIEKYQLNSKFCCNDKYIIRGSVNGIIYIYDLLSKNSKIKQILNINDKESIIGKVIYNKKENKIITGSSKGIINIFSEK